MAIGTSKLIFKVKDEINILTNPRSPTFVVQIMTPEEACSGRKPTGEKCVFLGVSEASKAYKLFNLQTKKIVTTFMPIYSSNTTPTTAETSPTTIKAIDVAAHSFHHVQKRLTWMKDYEKYVEEILDKFWMKDCNPVGSPIEFGLKLKKDHEGKKVDSTLYKQIVGSLMYLTTTRLDIMYYVSLISRYMENPKKMLLLAAKKIFRYAGNQDSRKALQVMFLCWA
ncbi:Uncharacterized protein TCM_019322 [Theobroma cacao]|uniref:Retroviral polymerase SH3-like domain-containing protein n=1 Tax=Theobroma cacao TaxID=3641 RepID=A0A061EGB5_THECC|nr:Uncharacterized protein TCM_019322 [Theobroma cacao]